MWGLTSEEGSPGRAGILPGDEGGRVPWAGGAAWARASVSVGEGVGRLAPGAPERFLWDIECQAAYLALSW